MKKRASHNMYSYVLRESKSRVWFWPGVGSDPPPGLRLPPSCMNESASLAAVAAAAAGAAGEEGGGGRGGGGGGEGGGGGQGEEEGDDEDADEDADGDILVDLPPAAAPGGR